MGRFLLCRYVAGLLRISVVAQTDHLAECLTDHNMVSLQFICKPYICRVLIEHQTWRTMWLVFPRDLCNAVIVQHYIVSKEKQKINNLVSLGSQRSEQQKLVVCCNQQSILLENFKRSLMT